MTFKHSVAALSLMLACGSPGSSRDGGGDSRGDGGLPSGDGGYVGPGDMLDTAAGCAGVYNPGQVLEFRLTMSASDWSTVRNDCIFETYVPADLTCNDGPSIRVGVRHKRSGGTAKPGLKIDINHVIAGQSFHGLKKMSWENGNGSSQDGCGDDGGEVGSLLAEYLAWRMHVRSGALTGRAAFIRVFVNGEYIGAYVNVEQVDKSFLKRRVGNDSGWLWKVSGSADDGLKTNEGTIDPYDDYFCFFGKNGCPPPPDATLQGELPQKLNIPQILTMGAVNALMANTDAPILKLNNFFYYDYAGGGRMYFPWDLDTVMRDDYDVYTGTVSGGTTAFTDVLFTHWQDDYRQIVNALLSGPLSVAAIGEEIDQAVRVAGSALESDPIIGGDAASAGAALRSWWTARHAQVSQ